MATLQMDYYEIIDSNITGVKATIYSDDGRVVARYCNFDPDERETYGNQSDSFAIPSVEAGMLMMQSNKGYHQISLTEEDLENNSNISSVPIVSDKEQISIRTGMGLITAQLEKEENYPGVRIFVDGTLASAVECCEDEERLMIRNYVESHEAPVSVDVKTAEVSIPKHWPAEIKPV